jgi:hypothetical protein
MTKEQFLFALLSLELDEDYKDLTDEEKWENTPALYKEFRKSDFFDPETDEAECIISYLKLKNNV